MATKLDFPSPERIIVLDGEVRIETLVETDPWVVRVLETSESPEDMTHVILRIGAQAALVAQVDLDSQVVERRFDGMTNRFNTSLEEAVTRIHAVGTELFGEDNGALPTLVEELKSGIGSILEETFDEDSKSGVIAKIDSVLDGAMESLDRRIRATFDPDAPDSALARTKLDILEVVREQSRDLRRDVQELATAVASTKARAEAVNLSAIKGFTYEEVLADGLTRIAAVHADLVEAVGTTTGARGTKNGDQLVTLSTDDTCGNAARFVLECKDRKLSMTKAMAELDKSMDNHSALAAIAVFSRQELAPTPIPFSWSGNRAVLVYDKDEPDDAALQVAYAWARWICRRALTADDNDVDVACVEAALTRAQQALQRHQAARSCFSTATKKINEGAAHVADLVDDVRTALNELRKELGSTAG
jgi:hypothetical protein